MTNKEKIEQITEIIESEGYYIKHSMMPFALFKNPDIEHDKVKSYVRLDERGKYSGDVLLIAFNVSICRMSGSNDLSTEDNREIANYLLHMCDVVDKLNAFELVIDRDLHDLGF